MINLLYKDHLLAHAYLTLCSDLVSLQRHYDAQARIKPHSKSINEIIQANYAIMSLAELAELLGVSKEVVNSRRNRLGIQAKQCLKSSKKIV